MSKGFNWPLQRKWQDRLKMLRNKRDVLKEEIMEVLCGETLADLMVDLIHTRKELKRAERQARAPTESHPSWS